MQKIIIIGMCITLLLVSGCGSEKPIGTWEEIADSVNSTHYQQTELEIDRLCVDLCGGRLYYRGYACPCNHCYCKCNSR